MLVAKSRLTAQGQVSVPAEVRRRLGLGPGSVIEWRQVGDEMLVRRVGTFSSETIHQAVFPMGPGKRTLADLKLARLEHIRKKHAR